MNIVSPEYIEGDYEVEMMPNRVISILVAPFAPTVLTRGSWQVMEAAYGYQWTEGVLQGAMVDCGTCDKPLRRVTLHTLIALHCAVCWRPTWPPARASSPTPSV